MKKSQSVLRGYGNTVAIIVFLFAAYTLATELGALDRMFFPTPSSTSDIYQTYQTKPNMMTSGYVALIWFWGIRGIVALGIDTIQLNPNYGQVEYQGLGAAYGMVLAVIILVLTLFQFWLDKKNAE
mgnify:CR=1 FL=1